MMTLATLCRDIVSIPDDLIQDIPIAGLAHDSRKVENNFLFVAISGYESDGHVFIKQAVSNGAKAVIVEKDVERVDIPVIRVQNSRRILAELANRFYDEPAKQLRMIGVTGTNGKTTVSYLLESIFKQARDEVGLIGTLEYRWKSKKQTAARTTPDALQLQQILKEMKDDGVNTVVMEVSSHALAMDRVWAMPFQVAVFTNLSRDHLDFHDSLESYRKTKSILFQMVDPSGVAVLNGDDPAGQALAKVSQAKTVTYGFQINADYQIKSITANWDSTTFSLQAKKSRWRITSPLCGEFNTMNSAAAAVVGIEIGLDSQIIQKGIQKVQGVPGRMESIQSSKGFGVVVDYAHTPDALENVLKTVRLLTKEKVIVVFGCGGDRDPGKRMQMGQAASDFADEIIVTSDNPRSEDPEKIINEIFLGISPGKRIEKIIERKEAIHSALERALPGDTVLIAGKGHETYQEIQGKRFPFDDRMVVKEYFSSQDTT